MNFSVSQSIKKTLRDQDFPKVFLFSKQVSEIFLNFYLTKRIWTWYYRRTTNGSNICRKAKGGILVKEYDEKTYRNPKLFDVIRAYLLLKMGTPLTPKSIADDLNRILAENNFKTNDVTIKKYLGAMLGEEVLQIKRVYIKPSYFKCKHNKESELEYSNIYYLKYSDNKLKEIFKSESCVLLREALHRWHPSLICIQRQTHAALELHSHYKDNLKSGVLVHQYYGDDGKEIKLTITVDFILEENGQKTVFMFGNKNTVFNIQNSKRVISPQDICDALKSVDMFKIKIVTFWNEEPQNGKYNNIKKYLPGNCEFVAWNKISLV